MYYKLQNGILIKQIGRQDLKKGTVVMEADGEQIECPMFMDEDGDIGFTIFKEDVLFHWLRLQPY